MPFSTYTKLGLGELAPTKLIVELADRIVKHPKGIAENVLVWINKFVFPIDFIVLDMPEDIKNPLILGRPFLSTAHAKINVFKRKITLRVGDDKVVFKKARLIGEALIYNRSLDPLYEDYIELNDLNEPLELRRNQVDDLEPTIEGGEIVDEPMMDIVKTRVSGRTGDQDGQGGDQGIGANGGVDEVLDFSTVIAQQLQNLLPTIVAQVCNHTSNIQGDVRSANVSNGRNGCSYKEFMAYNLKDYDGKSGAIVYTR
ncbi:integrase, catalytic region, zinc finger, CCHC-type containing protein [Tanacetum coccineum]